MPSSLAPLDPQILKENLPEDIHAIVDQLTTNVNQAVGDLVERFRKNASQIAEEFARAEFSGDMKAVINKELDDLNSKLKGLHQAVDSLNKNAQALSDAAKRIDPTALNKETGELITAAAAASTALTDFQTHVNAVGSKLGGAIASSAVKLLGGL